MTETPDDWRRVWGAVNQQRILRGMSWSAVYEYGGVSQKTMKKMRDDGTPLRSEAKRASLSQAIGWTVDSVNRILEGRPPELDETLANAIADDRVTRDEFRRLSAAVDELTSSVESLVRARIETQDHSGPVQRPAQPTRRQRQAKRADES